MSGLSETILVVGLIAIFLSIIGLFYLIMAFRRITITTKKIDYLVEDLTYKSEMLNSTIEIITKITNYIDVLEVITKKNAKVAVSLMSRNRDQIYKVIEKIKEFATKSTSSKNKTKKTNNNSSKRKK